MGFIFGHTSVHTFKSLTEPQCHSQFWEYGTWNTTSECVFLVKASSLTNGFSLMILAHWLVLTPGLAGQPRLSVEHFSLGDFNLQGVRVRGAEWWWKWLSFHMPPGFTLQISDQISFPYRGLVWSLPLKQPQSPRFTFIAALYALPNQHATQPPAPCPFVCPSANSPRLAPYLSCLTLYSQHIK